MGEGVDDGIDRFVRCILVCMYDLEVCFDGFWCLEEFGEFQDLQEKNHVGRCVARYAKTHSALRRPIR